MRPTGTVAARELVVTLCTHRRQLCNKSRTLNDTSKCHNMSASRFYSLWKDLFLIKLVLCLHLLIALYIIQRDSRFCWLRSLNSSLHSMSDSLDLESSTVLLNSCSGFPDLQ